MTIAIEALASFVPERYISNFDRTEEFGIDNKFIHEKLGVEKVSRIAPEEDTADLAIRAIERIEKGFTPESIDCLVVCTQNPHGNGIPHTSAVIHGRLGFPDHCACFDIGLGCSGYVYSLSVIKSFMESNSMQKGLLVTCDPYSKILDKDDRSTVMLFGDGATATVVGREGVLVPTLFQFGTCGSDGAALNNDSGTLTMNGRAVFGFSITKVPKQILDLLALAGLEKDEIDYYLFHQGSRFIVDQLTRRLGLSAEKVPMHLLNQGNTVSSTIPLLLEKFLKSGEGRIFLLSGFGVGLSWASCLLKRQS